MLNTPINVIKISTRYLTNFIYQNFFEYIASIFIFIWNSAIQEYNL